MWNVGVSLGTPETFAASRSAKKKCRNAFDSIDVTHSANSSRSRIDPSWNERVKAASMASIAANGARTHRSGLHAFVPRRIDPSWNERVKAASMGTRAVRGDRRHRSGLHAFVPRRIDP